MTQPTQLDIDLATVKSKAAKFTYLNQFLNWSSIENQAARKYPTGIESTLAGNTGKPFDLLQSLLAPAISFSGPIDYKLNLEALDICIREIFPKLTLENQTSLKNKLSNIGNTSFWDTLGELWFSFAYLKAGQNIKVDFPLHPQHGSNQPSDADIAFVDTNGNPTWLFDAICPNMPPHLDELDGFFDPNEAKIWLEQVIENKFQNKFAPYIANHAPAQAAVIVTLIKADAITAQLAPLLIANLGQPIQLDPILKTKCTGLGYAIVVRFQRNKFGNTEFIKIAELN